MKYTCPCPQTIRPLSDAGANRGDIVIPPPVIIDAAKIDAAEDEGFFATYWPHLAIAGAAGLGLYLAASDSKKRRR